MMQADFKYSHSAIRGMPLDVRVRSGAQAPFMDYYFLGFRIKCAGDFRYHHAWVVADDHETLALGASLSRDGILEGAPNLSDDDIDLVHVQSLQLRHLGISPDDTEMIRVQLQDTLEVRNDLRFAYLAYDPAHSNIALSRHLADDALEAAIDGRQTWRDQFGDSTRTWGIFQAHPVMTEFTMLFSLEAPLVEALLGDAPATLPN